MAFAPHIVSAYKYFIVLLLASNSSMAHSEKQKSERNFSNKGSF